MSCDLTLVMRSKGNLFLGWELLTISHHPMKFGVNRYCVSGDIMGLVCHVILQYHMIKGLCDFMGQSSS